jgi:FkbH-like protein
MMASPGTVDASLSQGGLIAAARSAERDGRSAEAERAYVAALSENPKSSAAALGLVRLLDGRGDRHRAQDVLRTFVAAAGTGASLTAAARQWEAWQDSPVPNALTVRVAITGSGTLAPLGAQLRVACGQAGLHPAVHVGDFNQWAQDLLSPASSLYAFAPDVILLVLAPTALFPKAVSNQDADGSALAAERVEGLSRIQGLLDAVVRSAPRATLVINTFAVPDRSPFGILDLKLALGQRGRIAAINLELADLVRERHNVLLLDQERVEARFGKARVRDARLWYVGGLPFSEAFLPVLAAEYMRVIRPLKGLVRKCIVLDLDNTLWGGVIGEDGLEGITLGGNDAPGNAFYDFQLALDGLRRRGVLLALCSRNNPEDAWAAIDSHPHMVLRRHHFAASRVNWTDKASNIIDIARELNLGLDSFVFLDDNPAERALLRHHVPDVLTVDLPGDPSYYTETLLNLDVFESLGLTDEDRARGEMYLQAQARREFEQTSAASTDLTAHLESLEIAVTIERACSFAIPRIAQLVNKTNQFNLTTRRYTEAQVRAMSESPASRVYAVRMADRFGDLGLTGVAIVHTGSDTWVIDSFLLSCRILGRGIEDALLAHIIALARESGARILQGHFIPTAKNAPARGFYPGRGFDHAGTLHEDNGADLFEASLDSFVADTSYTRWLRVTIDENPCS